MPSAHNFIKQKEEVNALTAIYEDDFKVESESHKTYSIKIRVKSYEVILTVTTPPDYPLKSPPTYQLSAPWMDRITKVNLHHSLDEVYLASIGETVMFQWVEKIREVLHNLKTKKNKNAAKVIETKHTAQMQSCCPEITHGQVITDRKSSFQGHAAEVHSLDDITAVLRKLKENKKIQNAKHNMYAYRIEQKTDKGTKMLQDCDNDGENQAGGRMLHLLQILDQKNTLVIVTRWYGGIQLGADRFRHINNASKIAIQQAGLLNK